MHYIASTSMTGLNNFNAYDRDMSPYLKLGNPYNPHNQFDLSPQQNSAIMSTPLKKRQVKALTKEAARVFGIPPEKRKCLSLMLVEFYED